MVVVFVVVVVVVFGPVRFSWLAGRAVGSSSSFGPASKPAAASKSVTAKSTTQPEYKAVATTAYSQPASRGPSLSTLFPQQPCLEDRRGQEARGTLVAPPTRSTRGMTAKQRTYRAKASRLILISPTFGSETQNVFRSGRGKPIPSNNTQVVRQAGK